MPDADRLIVLCEEELAQGPSDIAAHPEENGGIVHGINYRILLKMYIRVDTIMKQAG